MIVKIHKGADGKKVIAVCDSDLVGRKFEENGLQLDLKSSFYKGEEKDGEFILKEINQPCHLNIVGKNSIDFCIKKSLINKENIISIKGIPHAQCAIVD